MWRSKVKTETLHLPGWGVIDKNGPKKTNMDGNDGNGQQLIELDGYGQNWRKMDGNGRKWM